MNGTHHYRMLINLGIGFALAVGGCGGSPAPLPGADAATGDDEGTVASTSLQATPHAVVAMSRHYVEVTFDSAVGPEAADVSRYAITGPAGELPIVSARVSDSGTSVILTTAEQSEVEYQLAVATDKLTDKSSRKALMTFPVLGLIFKGSSGSEPYLASAIALDDDLVLLTYSASMDDNIAQHRYYEIADPDLTVHEALAGQNKTTVLLRTSSQENIEYRVKATNVTASNGKKLIDPTRCTATFNGIAPNSPPVVTGAVATGATSILVSFNKPLADDAADPTHFSLAPTQGGTGPTIVSAVMSLFNTQVELTTLPMIAGESYRLTVAGVKDRGGNSIGSGNQAIFLFQGQVATDDAAKLPRVVGAIATGNTRVRVTFNKAMGAGLDDPKSYSITGTETSFLLVFAATPGPGGTYVDLVTSSQAPGFYTVRVVNVYDQSGNALQPPSGLLASPMGGDPNSAVFAAVPPVINRSADPPVEEHIDTDEDGFADWFETLGWMITVHLANGEKAVTHVTSDPFSPDTDGDGIDDSVENQYSWDPRTDDTDADHLTDYDEFFIYYSDPAHQDTDEDGILDELEVNSFGTSPILADTDGDGMSDAEELFQRNRNPLIADLPVPQITVGDIGLDLKITSSFTTETGTTQSDTSSSSVTFAQSRSDTLATGSTTSTEIENNFSQEVGGEIGYDDGPVGKVFTKAGFEQNRSRGFSSTVNRETARQSQQEWQNSVERAMSLSENRAVTRSIDEASIKATVNLANRSDIAFSITNLELSVLQQDRLGPGFRPIATLKPSGENIPVYNLGPLDGERGPIIFESVNVFPNLVETLMREPTGLVFKIVNYDILDEFGRNFAFSSQDVVERTAGIEIDFGGGVVETYRVATASTFDPDSGAARGITLERALEIIGLTRAEEDPPLPPLAPGAALPPGIRKTYGTTVFEGVERLTRVRGVQNDRSTPVHDLLWVVMTSNEDVSRNTDFSEIRLYAGDRVQLWFTTDADGDNLFAREEFLYGSRDNSADTDNDDLGDYFEVRSGWIVNRLPGLPYRVFSDPSRADSDLDGLLDVEEFQQGTDPNRADTDEDGLLDGLEIKGPMEVALFDGDADETNNVILTITPYQSAVDTIRSQQGRRIQTSLTGDDRYVGVIEAGSTGRVQASPAGDDFPLIICVFGCRTTAILPGANGYLDTVPAAGDRLSVGTYIIPGTNGRIDSLPVEADFYAVAHARLFATDPLNRDTDQDGLPDGRELVLGSNPNGLDSARIFDSDNDGLSDDEEDQGWFLAGTTTRVTSNKLSPDTDLDGIPDVFERAMGSNPRSSDTDGDTLSDRAEFDPLDQDNHHNDLAWEDAVRRCASASSCAPPTPPATVLRTSIVKADSDNDTLADQVEVNQTYSVTITDMGGTTATRTGLKTLPYRADTDGDGLGDAEELALQTDPTDVDSDADGTSDTIEMQICVQDPDTQVQLCRSPIQADRLVTFTYDSVTVDANCDGAAGRLELLGALFLTPPGSSELIVHVFPCIPEGNPNGYSQGDTHAIDYAKAFRMTPNQLLSARGGEFFDNDGSTCGPQGQPGVPDRIGDFIMSYTFADMVALPASGQISNLDSVEVTSRPQCAIRFNMQVQIH